MIKKLLLVTALSVGIFLLSGCQTVQGIGRDITWTGEAVANLIEGSNQQ